MLILNLTHSLINFSSKFPQQLLTMTFVYLKKIGKIQQTLYVITKNNAKIEKRDNINT